jgi:hypothetical protein
VSLEPDLERAVAVDRDGDPSALAGLAIDAVTAVDA